MVGYHPTNGYRLVVPTLNRLLISREVLFDKKNTWDWHNKIKQGERMNFVHFELVDENTKLRQLVLQNVDAHDEISPQPAPVNLRL